MKYAAEVIGLLAEFPGREFRIIQIVRHVLGGHPRTPYQWERVRKGVRRVLSTLEDSGQIQKITAAGNGSHAAYCWKPGHLVVENRDRNRDNKGSTVAS
ncbi:hypothetical protein KVP10_08485 [Candidimonas humi]|uniref:Helix-turn-helix domain-containing protein n=1 Tax=Candidimonas humi TaxID=683355 RepID=A0ABV8NXM3_9BURK|nr:hypothetical protein [Candidimonas humi]MBV6304923.1 hypothetical protein [Candidimonas humi]